jgi:uncharacterized GH25 family protein
MIMKRYWLSCCLLLCFAGSVEAHDLYLKLDDFFVKPTAEIAVRILNGSFMSSESPVAFSRLNDASLVWPSGEMTHPAERDFTLDENISSWNIPGLSEGTYVVALSTKKREIGLSNEDFDAYLAEDGIPDILADRRKVKPVKPSVYEMYSKHVKMIFQVGNTRTNTYKTVIGYSVEIIPQSNPYSLKVGDDLEFLCLRDGKPLPNQYVMTGRDSAGELIIGKNIRTDATGRGRIKIDGPGKWYLKFIHMVKMNRDSLDYESNWTTLTFGVR